MGTLKSSYLLGGFALLLNGCTNKNDYIKQADGHYLKTELYNSGAKKSEQQFISDAKKGYMPDGYFISFYENGNISDSVRFVSGNKEGWEMRYYENSKKRSGFFYRDGKLDSIGYILYPNGNTAEWHNRIEGMPVGMQFKYDSLRMPTSIVFATALDTQAFTVHFDEKGGVRKMEGAPLYVLEKDHNKIRAGDTFSTLNFLYQYGSVKAKLNIFIKEGNKVITEESVSSFGVQYNGYVHYFDYVFEKPGTYSYNAIIVLYDTLSRAVLKMDTAKATVIIKEQER